MDLKEYQATIRNMPLYDDLCYGLITEVGEVVDIIKKGNRPGRQIDRVWLGEEIGDVLWYLTRLADSYDLYMPGLLNGNVEKLNKRHSKDSDGTVLSQDSA